VNARMHQSRAHFAECWEHLVSHPVGAYPACRGYAQLFYTQAPPVYDRRRLTCSSRANVLMAAAISRRTERLRILK
jgi:hypothetical protein